jgi:hypothetical protein
MVEFPFVLFCGSLAGLPIVSGLTTAASAVFVWRHGLKALLYLRLLEVS